MYLIYFDERKNDSKQPDFWFGGIGVDFEHIAEIEGEVSEIAQSHFGDSRLGKETEFHGVDILHGKANFKGKSIEDRLNLYESLLDIIAKSEVKKIFCRVMVENISATTDDPRDIAFMMFAERANSLCHNTKGLLIGDRDKQYESSTAEDFSHYKEYSTKYRFGVNIDKLVDSVYFGNSHHSRLLQLADLYTYALVNNHLDLGKYPHQKLKQLYSDRDMFPAKYKKWPKQKEWNR